MTSGKRVSYDKQEYRVSASETTKFVSTVLIEEIENSLQKIFLHVRTDVGELRLKASKEYLDGVLETIMETERGDLYIVGTGFSSLRMAFVNFYVSFFYEFGFNVLEKYKKTIEGKADTNLDDPTDVPPPFLTSQFYEFSKELDNASNANSNYYNIIYHVFKMRNLTYHTNNPDKTQRDFVTSEKFDGNLYTLASTYVLSLYAYIELLQIWTSLIS